MDRQKKILVLIFIIALAFRLFFAFSTLNLDHEAYYTVRQIESIKQTGLPIFQDDLSYGGRTSFFIPFYHYFLAGFSFLMPITIVLKLIPNILASSIIFINYLIAKKLTQNKNTALFCAFISAFIPIFITQTVNSASVLSLTIPLIFLSIFFLINLNKPKYITYFLLTAFSLTIIHPISFLLIAGLLLYLLIIKLENLPHKKEETESILFITILAIWINIILYKKAFLAQSYAIIWQNTPHLIQNLYFVQTDFFAGIIQVGLIPLIFGAYAVYKYVFREKNKETYLLSVLTLTSFCLVWFKLIQPVVGLTFLGVILPILFVKGYQNFFNYLKTTKLAKKKIQFHILFIAIFILTSITASFYFTNQKISEAPTETDIQALEWIKENTDNNSIIAASLKEGHLINAIAQRKNIIDTNFLFAPNTEERYQDIKAIFHSPRKTEVISTLDKNNAKYILFSETTKREFKIEELHYLDKKCFKPLFNNHTIIYQLFCQVEEI